MKIGCFALIHPFQPLDAQLAQIAEWGFRYADVTDNSDGATLGTEFGFAAVASLDANPHDIRRQFAAHGLEIGSKIEHVHWKDMPAAMESKRGTCFGCGMATIALGDGVVGIAEIVRALRSIGFDGHTTLEIAGAEAVRKSAAFLESLS